MEPTKEISNTIINKLKKINLYQIPQYAWLTLLYYLMLNTFFEFFISRLWEPTDPIENIPTEMMQFNNTIMHTIEEWLSFSLMLSIAFIFSGLFIAFIQFIPILSSYKMSFHGAYGLFLGLWMLLASITVYLYKFLGFWFPFTFPFIFLISILWKKILPDFSIS